jgi:hypothetical protein
MAYALIPRLSSHGVVIFASYCSNRFLTGGLFNSRHAYTQPAQAVNSGSRTNRRLLGSRRVRQPLPPLRIPQASQRFRLLAQTLDRSGIGIRCRNPHRRSDRFYLVCCWGNSRTRRAGATQDRMCRNPTSLSVPVCVSRWRFDDPPPLQGVLELNRSASSNLACH